MAGNQPFAKRLKEARLRKAALLKEAGGMGLSQEALGVAAGIDEVSAGSRVNHYEQGRHLPDLEMASRLAKALDVPLAYLFCEEDWIAKVLLLIHGASEERQAQLLELIQESDKRRR